VSTWLEIKLTNAKLFVIYQNQLFPDATGKSYKFSPFSIWLEIQKITTEGWQAVIFLPT